MALVYKTYRPMEQNGNPRNNGIYGQIIFNKGIQWRKDNLFNKYCWEYQISRAKKKKKMKLDFYSTPKIDGSNTSISDLTLYNFQKKPQSKSFMTEFDNDFLDMTPKTQVTKEKLKKKERKKNQTNWPFSK